MPVGEFESVLYANPVAAFLARTFGAKGLHEHLRIAPLIRYAQEHYRGKSLSVLEIGCGEGWALFELAKVPGVQMTAEGYDFDAEDIAIGTRIAAARFPFVSLHCEDATQLADMDREFDLILFMDFLEHVTEPGKIISRLLPCLKKGGEIIVSVPTPNYPGIFTREMHERIGHILDGYTEETLAAIFPPELHLSYSKRNTGSPAKYGCWLQARLPRLPYILDWFKNIAITVAFRKLDWFNGPGSCSLFAVFTKL